MNERMNEWIDFLQIFGMMGWTEKRTGRGMKTVACKADSSGYVKKETTQHN